MSTISLGLSQSPFGGGFAPEAPGGKGNSFLSALIDSAEQQNREKARREALAAKAAKQIAEAAARNASRHALDEVADDPVDVPAVIRQLQAPVRQLRAPVRPAAANPLMRVWGWLNRRCTLSTEKQLRVAETVSLGEKRFVAVVHAGGEKFLIGGGAQGVSLLTKLEGTGETQSAAAAFADATSTVEDGE